MASLDTFVGKYIRLTEDLHEMRAYLNDIRICFVALTVSCYLAILLYALVLCARRRPDGPEEGSRAPSRTSRFRGPGRRSASRLDDAESGTAEWDDMMPPPPNGQAVKTLDGYRYRNPRASKLPFQNRLSVQGDALEGKRPPLLDNHQARSPGEHLGDGFLEKSPSLT